MHISFIGGGKKHADGVAMVWQLHDIIAVTLRAEELGCRDMRQCLELGFGSPDSALCLLSVLPSLFIYFFGL